MQTRPPKHPAYHTYYARLESYGSWPRRYVPKVPEELATAGFFYIGSADRVTCFQCGITLRDWEEEHDPVEEHRRYSETCPFINEVNFSDLGVLQRSATDTQKSRSSESPDSADGEISSHGNTVGTSEDHVLPIEDTISSNATDESDLGGGACARPVDLRDQSTFFVQENATNDPAETIRDADPISEQLNNVSLVDSDFHDARSEVLPYSADALCKNFPEQANIQKPKVQNKNSKRSGLLAENRRLKEEVACKRCGRQVASILFLPCGHLVTCQVCAAEVEDCVTCHVTILGTVKTFRA